MHFSIHATCLALTCIIFIILRSGCLVMGKFFHPLSIYVLLTFVCNKQNCKKSVLKHINWWGVFGLLHYWSYALQSYTYNLHNLFSSSIAFLMMSVASQKCHTLILISVKRTGKNQLEPGKESMEDGPLSHCSLRRNPWLKSIVCWSIAVKMRKSTVGSPFFMVFPSDRNPKVMKDVKVHLSNHYSNSCKLYQ